MADACDVASDGDEALSLVKAGVADDLDSETEPLVRLRAGHDAKDLRLTLFQLQENVLTNLQSART